MRKMVTLVSMMSLAGFALDIPSQGETLSIPTGEEFIVNDSNVSAFLKVGSVDIPEGSSLVFDDLSQAMVTLSMPFTGKGNVVMKSRPVGEGFIMKADNSNFEGSFYITNSHIRVQTLTGIGVGRPVDYYSLKDKSNSRLQLEAVGNQFFFISGIFEVEVEQLFPLKHRRQNQQ